MKPLLAGLIFGIVMAAQPYSPRYGGGYGGGYSDRGFDRNSPAARIAFGERSGLLTPREAARLWDRERDLRREIERSLRNGYGISPRERARIENKRIALERDIDRQMRDNERMRGYGPGRRY